MATAKPVTDHDEIRKWVEARGGHPARVKATGRRNDPGILRIDFPGYSGEDTLEEIEWDEFFEWFDRDKLALLLSNQKGNRFNKLVSRTSSSTKASSKKASSKKASASSKKASSPVKKASTSKKSASGAKKKSPAATKKSSAVKKTSSASTKKSTAPARKSSAPAKKASASKKTSSASTKKSSSSKKNASTSKKTASTSKKTASSKKTAPSKKAASSKKGAGSGIRGAIRSLVTGGKKATSKKSSSKKTSSKKTSSGGASRTTTDHDEIRSWVEARGGFPAHVVRTAGPGDDPGVLRIDYPGFSGADSLERISWDQWFEWFDRDRLAFLYQDRKNSRFSKLVSR